jgi:hypothetical protein
MSGLVTLAATDPEELIARMHRPPAMDLSIAGLRRRLEAIQAALGPRTVVGRPCLMRTCLVAQDLVMQLGPSARPMVTQDWISVFDAERGSITSIWLDEATPIRAVIREFDRRFGRQDTVSVAAALRMASLRVAP